MKYLIATILLVGCQHLTPEEKAERDWWRKDLQEHYDAWEKVEKGTYV